MPKRIARAERAKVARAASIASAHYGVFRPLLFLPRRGKLKVATARQVAMYLAHCSGQVAMNRLTAAFLRDLATISHDIKKIEDMRDDNAFDAEMTFLEALFADGAA